MCGILGLLTESRDASAARYGARDLAVARGTGVLAHRGPDGEGLRTWSGPEGEVRFGHRRLAILDLSPAGAQPWVDPVTGHAVVFNGEIYNFRELRAALLASGGRPFVSGTDTEVLLRAWEAWGPASFARLRGIYAFAIRDARDGSVVLARDPLGVKPLYLAITADGLLFGSEVRALLASGLLPRRADPAGILSILAHGSVQEPFTLVAGVRSLAPGHLQHWHPAGRPMAQESFQSIRTMTIDAGAGGSSPEADPAYLADLRGRLADATRSQLVADVPVGVFLSGGLDSASLALLARGGHGGELHTFTLGFDDPAYDERAASRELAAIVGSHHHETLLPLAELPDLIRRAVADYDQPSRDGINTWLVARAARQAGATVVLSGVGGDELLGGYRKYEKPRRFAAIERRLRLLGPLRALAGTCLRGLPAYSALQQIADLADTVTEPTLASRLVFPRKPRRNLASGTRKVAPADWMGPAFGPALAEARGLDPINRIALLDLRSYALSTLLRDTDQMGMAHGLEIRVPLLDPSLVAHLLATPGHWKIAGSRPKPLLTGALAGEIPASALVRAKRGFELPFDAWIRGPLRAEVERELLTRDSLTEAWFDTAELEDLWKRFLDGRLRWTRLWTVHVLLAWLRRHGVS